MRELPPAASEVLRQVRQAHDPSSADVARSLSRLQASLSFGVDAAQAAAQVAQPAAVATPHVSGVLLTAKAIKLGVLAVALSGSLTGAMLGLRAPAAPARPAAGLAATPTPNVVPAVQRNELAPAVRAPEAATGAVVAERADPVAPEGQATSPTAVPTARTERAAGPEVRAHRKAPALPRVVATSTRHEEVPSPAHVAEPVADERATQAAKATPSELDLVSRAATSLRDGQWTRALSLLDEHRTLYPAGLLHTEQQGLRVLALCGLGHVEQANEARRDFLRDASRTPLAARVRRACAEPGRP